MAQKSDSQLNTDALVIKNETVNDANTADRIGTMYIDIISSKINNDQIGVTVAPLASPTFTGVVTVPNQSANNGSGRAANTLYVDTADALRLLLTGGTMSGNIAMGGSKVTGLAAASSNGEAVRYEQITPLAPLASPTFTGTPLAPTAAALTNNTQIATTAYVDTAVSVATPIGSASVRGLNKLYTATGSNTDGSMDQNSTTTAIGLRVLKAGDTMSGNLAMGNNKVTGLAAAASNGEAVRYEQITPLAPLASPSLTGTPTAPTAAPGTNTTQIATTAYADAIAALKVSKAGDSMTGNLAMGTNNITGLAAATANGHAVRYEQVLPVWPSLTDGSSITMDCANAQFPEFQLTTANAAIALTMSNLRNGSKGSWKIITNTASQIVITLPGGGLTHKRNNVTFTTIALPVGTGKEYFIYFEVVGSVIEWDLKNLAPLKMIQFAASDESTPLTAGTNKMTFRMPCAMVVTEVLAELTAAQTAGNIFTVDINEAGASILSTKLTIDNNEDDSFTATTPAVISDANLAFRAKITVDIDQIGNGTAAGLKITLLGV